MLFIDIGVIVWVSVYSQHRDPLRGLSTTRSNCGTPQRATWDWAYIISSRCLIDNGNKSATIKYKVENNNNNNI